jgi:hypothetical protein
MSERKPERRQTRREAETRHPLKYANLRMQPVSDPADNVQAREGKVIRGPFATDTVRVWRWRGYRGTNGEPYRMR